MEKIDRKIKVALADDHVLLRNALASLIDGFGNCQVIHQSGTGKELINGIMSGVSPDVVILDLSMPEMDGYQAAVWFRDNYPSAHILMLTMYDSDLSLIRLLQVGVKGFLKKDIHPEELRFAISSVVQSGYYYSTHTTGKLVNLFRTPNSNVNLQKVILSEPELEFLRLVCTDATYKHIAQQMKLNPRTIDSLRDQLFSKLDVKSRVGLVMIAIRHGIVTYL
jgi:DNA-binding NarL/FixJ family response regulator